jgi:hypothetical protein
MLGSCRAIRKGRVSAQLPEAAQPFINPVSLVSTFEHPTLRLRPMKFAWFVPQLVDPHPIIGPTVDGYL